MNMFVMPIDWLATLTRPKYSASPLDKAKAACVLLQVFIVFMTFRSISLAFVLDLLCVCGVQVMLTLYVLCVRASCMYCVFGLVVVYIFIYIYMYMYPPVL